MRKGQYKSSKANCHHLVFIPNTNKLEDLYILNGRVALVMKLTRLIHMDEAMKSQLCAVMLAWTAPGYWPQPVMLQAIAA